MHLFARACGSSFSPTPWRHRGTSTSHQSHVTRHAFFCFQQLTNCPICNSCALIMLLQWVGVPPDKFLPHYVLISLLRYSVRRNSSSRRFDNRSLLCRS